MNKKREYYLNRINFDFNEYKNIKRIRDDAKKFLLKFNTPEKVLETCTDEQEHKTNMLYKLFFLTFKYKLLYQSKSIPICYLLFLSQLLKDNVSVFYNAKENKPMLSFFMISPSGTGKGVICENFQQIVDLCGMVSKQVAKVTDAALFDAIDNTIDDKNKLHNLSPINMKSKCGRYDYEDPVIPGFVRYANFIVAREAKTLFNKGHHSENIMSIFQDLSDGKESTNFLKGVENKTYSSASYVFFSIMVDKFQKAIIEQGIFRRLILFISSITNKQASRYLLVTEELDKNDDGSSKEIFESLMKLLAESFILLKERFKDEKKVFYSDNSAIDFCQNQIYERSKYILNSGITSENRLFSITAMSNGLHFVIKKGSALLAAVRGSDTIEFIDVFTVNNSVHNCFLSSLKITENIKEFQKDERENNKILQKLPKGRMLITECTEIIQKMGNSYNTSRKKIKELISANKLILDPKRYPKNKKYIFKQINMEVFK